MSEIENRPTHTVSRFWCPRDGRFFLSDCGYLADPGGDARDVLNPDLADFSDISDQSCLVLLGEPGIGKTTALREERQAVDRRVSENNELLIWQDLSVYDQGDAPRLRDDIFADAQWQIWRDNGQTLHIYLDSFDECRLYLRNVANVLLDGLRRLPHCERILLRLACRTGAWSQHLEGGFRSLWGDDRVSVYELAPLRRTDVEDIARAGGIEDTVAFLAEVERRNAVPFAIKPVTLNFLIAIYLRDGRFPPTQAQLYEEGCLALCEERSPSRHSAGALGLSASENRRKSLASRIAAMTLFCGKDAIWVGNDAQRRPKTDLSLVEISGGTEVVDEDSFEVSVEAVRDRREAYEQVRVIVEVKGCWHAEVREAMQTQLRDRYLRDNNCQHGLYVVGWFLCDQWDVGDYRSAAAKRLMPENVEATQQLFDDQSRQLSNSGVSLRALVIDASLRSPLTTERAKGAKRTTRTKATGKNAARKCSGEKSAKKAAPKKSAKKNT